MDKLEVGQIRRWNKSHDHFAIKCIGVYLVLITQLNDKKELCVTTLEILEESYLDDRMKQKEFIELMLLSATAKKLNDTKIEIDYNKPMTRDQIMLNIIVLFIICPIMIILTITLSKRYEHQLEKNRIESILEKRK